MICTKVVFAPTNQELAFKSLLEYKMVKFILPFLKKISLYINFFKRENVSGG